MSPLPVGCPLVDPLRLLGAACDADGCGLFCGGAVLCGECCGHFQRGLAEIAWCGERAVGALGQVEREHSYRDIRDLAEGAAGDARFAYERFAVQVDDDSLSL